MNTTMADGAEQRLDAQIAEALFGQPGMSKMDVANRVRELRGDGPALLVPRRAGQDAMVPHARALELVGDAYNAGTPGIGYSQQAMELHDSIISARPSPAGQGALLASLVARWRKDADEIGASNNTLCQKIANCTMRHATELQAALAARQPVGEPVAYMTHHDEPMLYPTFQEAAAYCDDDEPPIPLYAAPPEKAVDLGADVKASAAERERQLRAEGKTCGDCVQCRRCTALFGQVPADESCDWSPSHYCEVERSNA